MFIPSSLESLCCANQLSIVMKKSLHMRSMLRIFNITATRQLIAGRKLKGMKHMATAYSWHTETASFSVCSLSLLLSAISYWIMYHEKCMALLTSAISITFFHVFPAFIRVFTPFQILKPTRCISLRPDAIPESPCTRLNPPRCTCFLQLAQAQWRYRRQSWHHPTKIRRYPTIEWLLVLA